MKITVEISACFDPEAQEWEYRKYSYFVKFTVDGKWRECFFYSLSGALTWVGAETMQIARRALDQEMKNE